MIRKCAKCDYEYDDIYDGCPMCARAETAGGARHPESSLSPTSTTMPMSPADLGPAGALGALLSFVAVIVVSGFFVSAIGSQMFWLTAVLNGLLWAIVVLVDYDSVKKPVPPDFKIEGNAGSSRTLWAVAAFMIAGIAVPMYFYYRPRIKRAFEIASQLPGAV
ncbi:MAG: hypothetical protein U1E22_04025 [Coriobacteriia bacterium]|nr:hypothetical protein [Coriobacteriia bacterium]